MAIFCRCYYIFGGKGHTDEVLLIFIPEKRKEKQVIELKMLNFSFRVKRSRARL